MEERIKVRCVNLKSGKSKRFNINLALAPAFMRKGWVIQDTNYEPIHRSQARYDKIVLGKELEEPSCSSCKVIEKVEDINDDLAKGEKGVGINGGDDSRYEEIIVEEKNEEVKPNPYETMTKPELMKELDKKEIKYSKAYRKEKLVELLK